MIKELVVYDVDVPLMNKSELLASDFDKDKARQVRQTPRRGDILSVRPKNWGKNLRESVRENRMIVRVRNFPEQMERRLVSYLYDGENIIHRRRFAIDIDKLKPKKIQTIWNLHKYLIDKEQ